MREEPSGITCYCIVPHPSEFSVLVHRDGERYQCPSVRVPKLRLNFFPNSVPAIRQEMRRTANLETTVLRHLRDLGAVQICVLEVQSIQAYLLDDYVWLDVREEILWADEHSAEAWGVWKSALRPENAFSALAPWEHKGWFDDAALWMQTSLQEADYLLKGPIEQLKGAWSWSSLLTARTDKGVVYFKADYERPPQEAAITLKLAERWPLNVPPVIAASAERGWMLMPDLKGVSLELLGANDHLIDYLSAVSRFAQIQRSTVSSTGEWTRLGCSDMTPPVLLRIAGDLFADTKVLSGGKEGLTREERTEFELRWPQIESMMNRLAASALPSTISNEDFRAGNIVVRDGVCLFFDWSSTVIAHPLFGINYFLNRMVRTNSEDRFLWRNDLEDNPRRTVASAFLAEWAEYAEWDQLVTEFWLCRRLSYLYEAVRCYSDLPFIGTASPWAAGTLRNVPHSLRQLLPALDYQPKMALERN